MSKELKNKINKKRERNKLKKNIFVASDFNSLDKAIDATKKIRDKIAGVKIGTELYAICGTEGLKSSKNLV